MADSVRNNPLLAAALQSSEGSRPGLSLNPAGTGQTPVAPAQVPIPGTRGAGPPVTRSNLGAADALTASALRPGPRFGGNSAITADLVSALVGGSIRNQDRVQQQEQNAAFDAAIDQMKIPEQQKAILKSMDFEKKQLAAARIFENQDALEKARTLESEKQKNRLELEKQKKNTFIIETLPSGAKVQRNVKTGERKKLPGQGDAAETLVPRSFNVYLKQLPDFVEGQTPTRAQTIAANKLRQADQLNIAREKGLAEAGLPKTAEAAGKAQMIEGAFQAVSELEDQLFEGGDPAKGAINRGLIAQMNISVPFAGAGLPGTPGREARSLMREALNAKLRSETGATARPEELDELEKIYVPSLLDNDRTIRSKMRRFKKFLEETRIRIDPRLGVAGSVRKALEGSGIRPTNAPGAETRPTSQNDPNAVFQHFDADGNAIFRRSNGTFFGERPGE